MTTLVDSAVAKRWDKAFVTGADKRYPSLDLVRLELWYFGHKPGRVLEYGFGSGVNTIHLAECGYDVDAIDAALEAKKLVERKLVRQSDLRDCVRLKHLPAEAKRLPYEDDIFDYVVAMSVLSLLSTRERIRKVLGELRRVLKPGGKIIVDINSAQSQFAIDGVHIGGDVYENRGRAGDEDPVHCYCPSKVESFLELVEPFFVVDDVGYSGHRYMNNAIHEYIVCARKA